MDIKSPSEYLFDLFSKTFKVISESNKYIIDQADRFVVWLVGYSIAGLYLIIDSSKLANDSWITTLLIFSVITGILYRIASYFYRYYFSLCEFLFMQTLHTPKTMNLSPEDITACSDINELVVKLKHDFGIEPISYSNEINNLEEDQKIKLLDYLKTTYQIYSEYVAEDLAYGKNAIEQLLKQIFGATEKQIARKLNYEQFSNRRNYLGLNFSFFVSLFLYILCSLCFILAILIFLFNL